MPFFIHNFILQRGFSLIYTDFKILLKQNKNEAFQDQTSGLSLVPQSISPMLCEFELNLSSKIYVKHFLVCLFETFFKGPKLTQFLNQVLDSVLLEGSRKQKQESNVLASFRNDGVKQPAREPKVLPWWRVGRGKESL